MKTLSKKSYNTKLYVTILKEPNASLEIVTTTSKLYSFVGKNTKIRKKSVETCCDFSNISFAIITSMSL